MKHWTARHRGLILIQVSLLIWLGGCSCRPTKKPAANRSSQSQTIEEMEAQRKKRDAEREKKKDFEIVDLQVMPSDEPSRSGIRPQSHVKPGHWFGAVQRMKANNFDFPKGDLEAECVDGLVKSIPLPGGFELLTTRGVSLPKGQEKNASMVLFAPNTKSKKFFFMSRLRPRGGGQQLDWKSELAIKMRAAECHFVVLADRADNYQFLKSLRFANPQLEGIQYIDPPVDYHIKLPKGTQSVDLSSHPLTWSTIAYVLWDDFDPDILSIAQQQALLDWLHWGGQLVVNGPRTLDRLSASFLGEYLPARAGKTNQITNEQLRAMNEYWSFDEPLEQPQRSESQAVRRRPITQDLTITDEEERPLCIELKLSESGRFVDHTGGLVAESRVGRGSIKVTAFNLPHPVFRSWAGYDSFINAGLLDRPARQFYVSAEGMVAESWAIPTIDRQDPRTTSQVRYFSRDATSPAGRRRAAKDAADDMEDEPIEDEVVVHQLPRAGQDTRGINGFAQDSATGVAGWNDKSDVSQLATASLVQSAGVDIPSSKFVAKAIGLYLVILVPLNWILFRLIDRVEWAWALIPLISIGGAAGVLRATQLDIGFVRSRTEVAVLEMQPGYDRAHVTRYIGFYTSLASDYEITGDDESSLLLPLATEQRAEPNVQLQFGDTVEMKGFNILSSSTGMVHSEQMLNVGGSIRLDAATQQVHNQTNLDLQGVVIVRRTSPTHVEWVGLGTLGAQEKRTLEFERLTKPQIDFSGWEASTTASRTPAEEGLNVRDLLDLATTPERLGIDETVLVGWSEEVLPGISVSPQASQVVARSIVVAQLQHSQQPQPKRDANSFLVQQEKAKIKSRELDAATEF